MNLLRTIIRQVLHWREYLQPNEAVILGSAAVLVGLAAGIGVWAFKWLIEFFHSLAGGLGNLTSAWGSWALALLPVLGGLIVGLIVHFFVGVERHHGVAGIMEAVALAGGRLRYKRIPAKTVAAALGIGSGASVGPEDPSVQIGSNLGSMFGQWLHMSDERVRVLVAAGAAAGVAAAFNAPIAGVFFALEIILGEIGGTALGTVLVASVVSAVFTQAVSGTQPAFRVPAYAFHSAWELPLYLGLGLLAGGVAAVYIRLLYVFQDVFHAWSAPRWIKPAAAGLVVGLVGLSLPQIQGVGYETIEKILGGEELALGLLFALLLAKLVMTPVSIGGGFMGGVFAPSLFLGASLGGGFGRLAGSLFPSLGIAPPAFAMVGMAAVLAGAVHAPLTAILLLFEMTHDYRIILPLMFAVAVSLAISQLLQRDSVYTLGLARKGIRLERGRDVELLQAIKVADVMQTEITTLQETLCVTEASQVLVKTRHHGLPVLNGQGDLIGILTVQDVDRVLANGGGDRPVGEICTRDLMVAYPAETIGAVLRRMSPRDIGRLPVVEPSNPRRLIGVLRRSDILRAYDLALAQRASLRHRVHQVRLGAVSGEEVNVLELVVEPGSGCANVAMCNIPWPRESLIASLRRGGQLMIPHGDTVLREGDVLAAVAEGPARDELVRLCKRCDPAG